MTGQLTTPLKFHVWAKPYVNFALTLAQIDMLIACSVKHYDGVCRAAGWESVMNAEPGFLQRWKRSQQYNDDAPEVERLEFPLTADNRTLQTCLKCLEMPCSFPEDGETFNARHALTNQLMVLLRRLVAAGERWQEDVEA